MRRRHFMTSTVSVFGGGCLSGKQECDASIDYPHRTEIINGYNDLKKFIVEPELLTTSDNKIGYAARFLSPNIVYNMTPTIKPPHPWAKTSMGFLYDPKNIDYGLSLGTIDYVVPTTDVDNAVVNLQESGFKKTNSYRGYRIWRGKANLKTFGQKVVYAAINNSYTITSVILENQTQERLKSIIDSGKEDKGLKLEKSNKIERLLDKVGGHVFVIGINYDNYNDDLSAYKSWTPTIESNGQPVHRYIYRFGSFNNINCEHLTLDEW